LPFDHALTNRYRSGDDRMGLHADDEPELGEDPVVAIVSARHVAAARRSATPKGRATAA
jgi:alkylated DNA repair dioxygenase AlkB